MSREPALGGRRGPYPAALLLLCLMVVGTPAIVSSSHVADEVRATQTGSVLVRCVEYAVIGSGDGRLASLRVGVQLVDGTGEAVWNAELVVNVEKNGHVHAVRSGLSNEHGFALVEVEPAPDGCYRTEVAQAKVSGRLYRPTTPENLFRKGEAEGCEDKGSRFCIPDEVLFPRVAEGSAGSHFGLRRSLNLLGAELR